MKRVILLSGFFSLVTISLVRGDNREYQPVKIEDGKITFRNGDIVTSDLKNLRYIGQMTTKRKKPFVIIAGSKEGSGESKDVLFIRSITDGLFLGAPTVKDVSDDELPEISEELLNREGRPTDGILGYPVMVTSEDGSLIKYLRFFGQCYRDQQNIMLSYLIHPPGTGPFNQIEIIFINQKDQLRWKNRDNISDEEIQKLLSETSDLVIKGVCREIPPNHIDHRKPN